MSTDTGAPSAAFDLSKSEGFRIEAVKVSWLGLTNKWGLRWVAQILRRRPAELLWECQHGHFRKTDAVQCGYQHYYAEVFE